MTDAPRLEDLLIRVAGGDRAAIAQLYRLMEQPLYRFVHSRLNDPHQSADIVHDVFLDVWRNAHRFEGRSAARTWIFGIAWRKVMDVYRAARRIDVTDDLPDTEDDSPDALTCIAAAEDQARVQHCLSTLKPDHRSALQLAFYEDLGYREIAEVMAVPEGTVKTRVFHAKKLMLHCLSQLGWRPAQ